MRRGRPQKLVLDFYIHDAHASNTPKIRTLSRRHGNDGYATYFRLLEMLCRQDGLQLNLSDPIILETVAEDCMTRDSMHFCQILQSCVEIGLFDRQLWEGERTLFSCGLHERFVSRLEERKKAAERKRKQREANNLAERIDAVKGIVTRDNSNIRRDNSPETETETETETNKELDLSLSSSLTREADERERVSSDGQNAIAHQCEAEEENCDRVPQPLFPRRPIAVSVAPKFRGPWGEGHTPELDQFESWLKDLAIAKNKPDPDSWAFRVIDSIAKGGPHSMWNQFKTAQSSDRPQPSAHRQTICEKLREDLKVDDPLSGYGGSTFRIFFNNLGYTFESRTAAFKRKYANYENLDEFIELAIYNGVLQPPSPDWFPTHPRQELEALVA